MLDSTRRNQALARRQTAPWLCLCLLFCQAVLSTASQASDDSYKPLFSREVLEKADEATRSRLLRLDAENRRRWEARRTQQPLHNVPAVEDEPAAAADRAVYQWRDQNGTLRFSDQPRPGAERVELDMRAPDPESERAYRKQLADQARVLEGFAYERETRARAEQNARHAQAQVEQRNEQCRKLKKEILEIRSGRFVFYETNEAGERQYFSEPELASKLASMEANHLEYCGPLPD